MQHVIRTKQCLHLHTAIWGEKKVSYNSSLPHCRKDPVIFKTKPGSVGLPSYYQNPKKKYQNINFQNKIGCLCDCITQWPLTLLPPPETYPETMHKNNERDIRGQNGKMITERYIFDSFRNCILQRNPVEAVSTSLTECFLKLAPSMRFTTWCCYCS